MRLRHKLTLLTTCLCITSTAALAAPNDHERYGDHQGHARPDSHQMHSDHGRPDRQFAPHGHQHYQAFGRNDMRAHEPPRNRGHFEHHTGPTHRPRFYARGDRFPHGVRWYPVDHRVAARLPHYRGYEWRRVGTDIILVGIATGVIYQVLQHGLY